MSIINVEEYDSDWSYKKSEQYVFKNQWIIWFKNHTVSDIKMYTHFIHTYNTCTTYILHIQFVLIQTQS